MSCSLVSISSAGLFDIISLLEQSPLSPCSLAECRLVREGFQTNRWRCTSKIVMWLNLLCRSICFYPVLARYHIWYLLLVVVYVNNFGLLILITRPFSVKIFELTVEDKTGLVTGGKIDFASIVGIYRCTGNTFEANEELFRKRIKQTTDRFFTIFPLLVVA